MTWGFLIQRLLEVVKGLVKFQFPVEDALFDINYQLRQDIQARAVLHENILTVDDFLTIGGVDACICTIGL